jgi:ubiquinone/menaquinone biosynthesis C-methylase UbiE
MIDKHNVIVDLPNRLTVCLELGCGSKKRYPGSIGIDVLDYPEVDLVGDIFEVLRSFPDSVVDEVHASHFIEHVSDIKLLMYELSRVVKVNGLVEFVAPHFSNPYFYSDPTHRSFFGLYTFCYIACSSLFSRQVPTYQHQLFFNLDRVDLRFKSARPFYFRYAIKFMIGKIFNSCTFMKELYEENFCYLIPCYEVYYRLRRIDVPVV